uniref:Uncharacterized protein n=1 Tax=Arundo donax TaxID=35708 RepID=A0A0A9FMC1_ARUDO
MNLTWLIGSLSIGSDILGGGDCRC